MKKSHFVMQKTVRWLPLVASALCMGAGVAQAQNDFVWIEGETTSSANIEAKAEGTARAELVSQGRWLRVNVEKDNIEKGVPEGGALLSYNFNVNKAGSHEIWNRIGYEASRTAFDWRIDGGEWTTVAPDVPTLDLTEISLWTDIGWLKLGQKQLASGAHKLEIRLPKAKNEKGEWRNISYASDAILVTPSQFHPNGRYKPGENYRDATDEQATKNVFQLPEPKGDGARASVPLKGLWEVARHDDNAPGEVASPIKDFPSQPHWKAIQVPSDKNKARPDLIFAHRLWYRTRINIPQNQVGRSFHIYFPLNNLNTTVYVNNVYCGFNKNPFAGFSIDVTPGIKAGVNEIWVGIRDAYYGFAADPARPQKLRANFKYPLEWANKGFMDLDYPVWNSFQSGILNTPVFEVGGPAYTSDVFVKPSVARKQLAAEVTLSNPTKQAINGELQWQAVNIANGAVEKTFKPQAFSLAAGASSTLNIADAWENPKLWWPDTPNLYYLRTIVNVGGKAVDVKDTKFGFREWGVSADRIKYTLNGVVWHLWAEIGLQGSTPQQWLADYRRKNQRTQRYSTAGQASDTAHIWLGLENDQALDFFDAGGVTIRRNTSPLDGEVIGYKFIEDDSITKQKQGGSELKLALMQNWRDTCVAQVRNERNHPSIQVWTIENEFAYINLINLLGNSPNMDAYEREITKTSDAVMAIDPTRTVMIDGGGALKDNSLPTHGDHYVFNQNDTRYPDLAYEPFPEGGGRGRWKWDMKRPRFIGEDYFATGINPADYAMWGGEGAFLGKDQARPAAGVVYRMLQEGYRWGNYYAAWHFWIGEDTAKDQYNANPWRAVFVRQWDWTFSAGDKVKRTFGIFNDTQYADPIVFTRTLTVGGKRVSSKTSTHNVAPGANLKFDETLDMPAVTTRQEGELLLTLAVGGKEIYRDVKAVSVLPKVSFGTPTATSARPATSPARASSLKVETRTHSQTKPATPARPAATQGTALLVFDPKGSVASFLKARSVTFTTLNTLENLPANGRVLIVGPDALDVAESTSSRLAAFASTGRTVIVLEQKNPLKYQAFPAEMETGTLSGTTAFIEDTNHPALRNLAQKDFFTWGPGSIYRDAYAKPTRGGKSLLQVGPRLQNSALVEIPTGKGLLLISQLQLGANLNNSAVAQQLLANLINYGRQYKQEFRSVAAAYSANSQLAKALDAIGLEYSKADTALAAISQPNVKLAVIEATPANLKQLADNLPRVNAFNQAGGYIVFQGLTPEGLADYNKLVGYNHIIRPYGAAKATQTSIAGEKTIERVAFSTPRHPLTAGLTLADVVMLSGQRIFGWTADEYVAPDAFSYVVDLDEVAPFGKSPFHAYGNITNNFLGADGWPLIINFEIPKDEQGNLKAFDLPIELPRTETITEFTWVGNTNYWGQTKVSLTFDGKDKVTFDTKPTSDVQTFQVNPPRAAKNILLRIEGWEEKVGVRPLVGIDNIYFKVQRPADFAQKVRPMLNIGAMVDYPRGKGGIALVNVLFKDNETVPLNAIKKRNIFGTVLRNLNAPFAGGKTVIAGANLKYSPIDIGKQATQYRNERGWFGDNNFTFAGLPTGRQTFAGVTYQIYDFPTSPVPTAIMLAGNGVPNGITAQEVKGIPVNQKADALFFLHTARMDNRRNDQERRENKKFEMLRYVVNYADGKQETVPVYAEIDIDDYKQKTPTALPGAQIAWTRPYEGTEWTAVAYSKQWNNPRPDVAITSIDMQYGPDRRGVPVLLAVTAATAAQ